MASQQEFWAMAREAIAQGLITKEEAITICRPGTRKAGYWGNHCRNLRLWIEYKKKGDNTTDDERSNRAGCE